MSLALDETSRTVTFRVIGEPAPQGGTKSVPIRGKGGEPLRTKDGRPMFRKITEGGVGLTPWRQDVADAAAKQAEVHGCLNGPIMLDVLFRFAMPKSRSKSARMLGVGPKTGKPDLDKLYRAVGDSLKAGGLIADDALIVDEHMRKQEVWERWTGCIITVGPAPPECWVLDP
jgi:Holliday junction resolvase RusA-like endonuclease